jgi:hypothetical protein
MNAILSIQMLAKGKRRYRCVKDSCQLNGRGKKIEQALLAKAISAGQIADRELDFGFGYNVR